MLLTQKIPIFPTPAQDRILRSLSEHCRLLYNFALAERIDNWKVNRDKLKPEQQEITYSQQQNQLPAPEYQQVYSKVLHMTLRMLNQNYKSFFGLWKKGNSRARPPKFKGTQHFTVLCYNQSGFKVEPHQNQQQITFSHKHPSKVELTFDLCHYPLPVTLTLNRIKQVEIFRNQAQAQYYLSVTYEFEEAVYHDNQLYQAIDIGITNLVSAVNIHGNFFQAKNRRADLYWRDKLREVQRKRDHCKEGSNRWHRYHQKLQQLHRRGANQLRDFQHQISKQIVEHTKAHTLIVGDLSVKNMVQNHANKSRSDTSPVPAQTTKTLNHSLQNTGSLGWFVEFLTYKPQKIGKKVIKIGEHRTTQVCANCGQRETRELSERTIHCDCGHRLDRNLNSALNIMVSFLTRKQHDPEFAIHHDLSCQPSVDEESFLHQWNGFVATYSPEIGLTANA